MAKAWFASVFCARFQDSQIIQKVFDFLADDGKLLTFLRCPILRITIASPYIKQERRYKLLIMSF